MSLTFYVDEEDVFGSDFESTDDEATQALDGGEYAIQYEEQKEKRVNYTSYQSYIDCKH